MSYRDTARTDGWCDAQSKMIAVGDWLGVNRQVAVLVHEVAHALGIDYEAYRREVAEVLVDTVGSLSVPASGWTSAARPSATSPGGAKAMRQRR